MQTWKETGPLWPGEASLSVSPMALTFLLLPPGQRQQFQYVTSCLAAEASASWLVLHPQCPAKSLLHSSCVSSAALRK